MKTCIRSITSVAALAAAWAMVSMTTALPALAQAAAEKPVMNTGDMAWMLTSTVIVLMMTIPGLALFYGGMVRKKNVLATVMQSFAAACLMSIVWMVVGYSIAFGDGGALNAYMGGFDKMFFAGMTKDGLFAPLLITESLFAVFQMTFAIITPALIAGAVADRMKFSSFLVFITLWMIIVYAPIAHWVWGGGFLGSDGVMDFAGGTVVHINSGVAGLVAALVLGRRKGYGTENMAPHNLVYTVMGGGVPVGRLVWLQRRFGWWRERLGCHGDPCHADLCGRRGARLDVRRVDDTRQAERARYSFGCHCRPCRHHSGSGLRRSEGRVDYGPHRRHRLLHRLDRHQARARL
jgi:Amt family ammonium transporter